MRAPITLAENCIEDALWRRRQWICAQRHSLSRIGSSRPGSNLRAAFFLANHFFSWRQAEWGATCPASDRLALSGPKLFHGAPLETLDASERKVPPTNGEKSPRKLQPLEARHWPGPLRVAGVRHSLEPDGGPRTCCELVCTPPPPRHRPANLLAFSPTRPSPASLGLDYFVAKAPGGTCWLQDGFPARERCPGGARTRADRCAHLWMLLIVSVVVRRRCCRFERGGGLCRPRGLHGASDSAAPLESRDVRRG